MSLAYNARKCIAVMQYGISYSVLHLSGLVPEVDAYAAMRHAAKTGDVDMHTDRKYKTTFKLSDKNCTASGHKFDAYKNADHRRFNGLVYCPACEKPVRLTRDAKGFYNRIPTHHKNDHILPR